DWSPIEKVQTRYDGRGSRNRIGVQSSAGPFHIDCCRTCTSRRTHLTILGQHKDPATGVIPALRSRPNDERTLGGVRRDTSASKGQSANVVAFGENGSRCGTARTIKIRDARHEAVATCG